MRTHKYLKRTGTPGNYTYFYKMPDGRVVAGNDVQQKQGRVEHAKRLLAGRRDGVHSMTHEEIAAETGHDVGKVRSMDSNLTRDQRLRGRAHDFEEHHLKEAKLSPSHQSYGEHLAQHNGGEGSPSAAEPDSAAPARTPRPAAAAAQGAPSGAHPAPVAPAGGEDMSPAAIRARAHAPAAAASSDDSETTRTTASGHKHTIGPDTDTREGHTHSLTVESPSGLTSHRSTHPNRAAAEAKSRELEASRGRGGQSSPTPGAAPAAPSAPPATETAQHREEQRTGQRTLTGRAVPGSAAAGRGSSAPASGSGAGGAGQAAAGAAPSSSSAQSGGTLDPKAELRRKLAEEHGIHLGGQPPAAAAQPAAAAPTAASGAAPSNPGRGGRQPPEGWQSTGSHIRRDVGDTHHQIGHEDGKSTLTISHGGSEIHRSQHDTVEGAVHASKIHEQRHAQAGQEDAATRAAMQAPAATDEPTHHPDAAPGSPHAAALSAADPDFAASERHLEHQMQTQQAGGNPYLDRAAEIFHRIQADVKEPRKTTVKHILQAMHDVKASGQPMSEENIATRFKDSTGSNLTAAAKKEFEGGTFHTFDEVAQNKPINAEVERMKRGFAAKQFARMKPFLGGAFKSAYPDAPPPYPTYNDLKGWDEHAQGGGGPRPDWAGGAGAGGQKKAMPKEFHDSMPKGADGKPMMPPGWLPLHLAPVWNYVAHSERGNTVPTKPEADPVDEDGGRSAAYAESNISPQDLRSYGLPTHDNQKVRMRGQSPTRAEMRSGERKPERKLLNSLRKYVQMRGGPDQLPDIPSSKLEGVTDHAGNAITHRELFKSDELTDQALQKIMTTKIIDPVGLVAALKKDDGKSEPVKKSIFLVVDMDARFVPGVSLKKSIKRDEAYEVDLSKAAKINRIEEILRGRADRA